MINPVQQEILLFSYWEHFKAAKDLAQVYPLNHHKRKKVENEMNVIIGQLQINK